MSRPVATEETSISGSRARPALVAVAFMAALFAGGTFVAPVLDGAGVRWGKLLRLVYAPACHQLPHRSLSIGGGPQAVCARCAGLYLGGAAGLVAGALLLYRSGRGPRALWLGVAVAPLIVEWALPRLGLPGLANVPRLLLALPAGTLAGLFLAEGVTSLFSSEPYPRETFARGPSRMLEDADG